MGVAIEDATAEEIEDLRTSVGDASSALTLALTLTNATLVTMRNSLRNSLPSTASFVRTAVSCRCLA